MVPGPDGKALIVPKTTESIDEEDRKSTEQALRKIAPGTRVVMDGGKGRIIRPGFWQRQLNRLTGHSKGTQLVSNIVKSKKTVTILVNNLGLNRVIVSNGYRWRIQKSGFSAQTHEKYQ